MRRAFAVPALIPALLGATPVAAQAGPEGFDLSGTIRLRLEAIADQARVGFGRDDDLVNTRTTILARWTGDPVFAAVELWDSRVWADDPTTPVTTSEVNTIEPVQAYIGAKGRIGGIGVTGTLGRMMLNIGSRRLIAADDYRNTTNGYTGVRIDLERRGTLAATFIYVLPQQRRPDDPAALRRAAVRLDREGRDLRLWGGTAARLHALGALAVEGSFYHLAERDVAGRPTRDRSLDTYGGRLMVEPAPGRPDLEVEAFAQTGRISASAAPGAARVPVGAWFIHADTGYTWRGGWHPRLSVEYDRASGDRAGGRYGRFDTLFGMRRADLAPSGLYNAVARANVESIGVRLEAEPSKRWDWFASYRALWAAERTDSFSTTGVRDPSGRAGALAGHQLDGRLRWWVRPGKLRFEADGVLLAEGRLLRDAPNATPGDTVLYGSLNLLASF